MFAIAVRGPSAGPSSLPFNIFESDNWRTRPLPTAVMSLSYAVALGLVGWQAFRRFPAVFRWLRPAHPISVTTGPSSPPNLNGILERVRTGNVRADDVKGSCIEGYGIKVGSHPGEELAVVQGEANLADLIEKGSGPHSMKINVVDMGAESAEEAFGSLAASTFDGLNRAKAAGHHIVILYGWSPTDTTRLSEAQTSRAVFGAIEEFRRAFPGQPPQKIAVAVSDHPSLDSLYRMFSDMLGGGAHSDRAIKSAGLVGGTFNFSSLSATV